MIEQTMLKPLNTASNFIFFELRKKNSPRKTKLVCFPNRQESMPQLCQLESLQHNKPVINRHVGMHIVLKVNIKMPQSSKGTLI